MNRKAFIFSFLLLAQCGLCQKAHATSVPLDANGRELYFDSQVVVEFNSATNEEQRENFVQGLGYSILRKAPRIHSLVLKVPSGKVLDYVESLKQNSYFKRVYPNYKAYLFSYTPYSFPNDPNYQNGTDEWNVNQVHMDQAWNDPDPWIATASLGRPSAKIAIVDTGILTTHQEFAGKIDPTSYNYLDSNTDLTDLDGHGTSTAGIASADTNNALGGVGICANCSLIIAVAGHGATIDIVSASEGINDCVFNGAKAVNCSFGSSPYEFSANSFNAWQNGSIVVGAMGNSGDNTEYSPASDQYAVGVGSVNSSEIRDTDSDYGSWIGLVAPVGGGIFSPSILSNSSYTLRLGTSAAAPQVTAMAAILIDLGLSPDQCRHDLFTTADLLGSGFNQYTGWGQMNCRRALAAIRPASSLSATPSTNQVSLNWVAPQTTAFATADYLVSRSTVSGGPYTAVGYTPNGTNLSFTDNTADPGTPYYYITQAIDAQGNTTVASNVISATALGTTWTFTPTPTATPNYGEFTGWSFSGLWHAVQDGVSPCANSYTHPWAAYYGVDATCTYATGASNAGTLTSPSGYSYVVCYPAIDHLNFYAWWQTDGGDTLTVQWAPYNNNNWATLWSTSSNSSAGWVLEQIPMASVTFGSIQLQFVVTTDNSANNARGWYIDDVTVSNCLTPTITNTLTTTKTLSPTSTLSITPTPTITPTLTMTFSQTPTFSSTYTPSNTMTITPTASRTMTPTNTPSMTPTITPTLTLTAIPCGFPGFTCTPTIDPSQLLYTQAPYPNPSRTGGQVTFPYGLSQSVNQMTLKIFTVSFRKVKQAQCPTTAGNNSITLNMNDLSNGLYYYVLEADGQGQKQSFTGKLLVLK